MHVWAQAIAKSSSLTPGEARILCQERYLSPHQRLALQRHHLSELFSLPDMNEHRMYTALKLAQPKLLLREVTASCFKPGYLPEQRTLNIWDKVMERTSTDINSLHRIVEFYHKLGYPSSLFSTTLYSANHSHIYCTRQELEQIPLRKLYELTLIQTHITKVGNWYALRLVSPWMLEMVDNVPHLRHITETGKSELERIQRRFWKVQEQYQAYFDHSHIVYPRLIGDE